MYGNAFLQQKGKVTLKYKRYKIQESTDSFVDLKG